jgi:FlaA1/EpsC-like NDP-sugar epimerase
MFIKKKITPLIALPRFFKRSIVICMDITLSLASVWIAFYLRLDQTGLPLLEQRFVYVVAPLLAVPIFTRFGLYRAIFRYTGFASMLAIVKAILLYLIAFFSLLLAMKFDGVPRSVGLIQPVIFLLFITTSRAMAKLLLSGWLPKKRNPTGRLLIYGAGEAGIQTAFALSTSKRYQLLAFIDEDTSKIGRSINGIDVICSRDVPDAIARMGITDILLAMPSLGRQKRNEIISTLGELSVHVQTLPSVLDLASGKVTVQDFQELDAEDLLGRAPVQAKSTLFAASLDQKIVLVTGAGGSIGGELCRQIALARPATLILVEHNEFSLYSIHQELHTLCKERSLTINIVPLLASISNYLRLNEILRLYKPTNVYHAAAYKHVPLVEGNPGEGILNNIWGTLNVARAAVENQVERFVLISTDKAVRPTNIMGATKRVAELVLQALNASESVEFHDETGSTTRSIKNKTLFSMVRFGNVLGSSGSVVPLFRKQLSNGGPLTVTHAEVTRYFMTIPEAAQLVLQAATMADGGDVFVLDMGKPVKILDLARRMIELSGMTLRNEDNPDGDIAIAITGLRPGEKLYEELLIGDNPEPTAHDRIMKAREDYLEWHLLQPLIVSMKEAAVANDIDAMKQYLIKLVPGYSPADHSV